MNIGTSQYDPELQMFTDQTREPDLGRLRFMRWLVEHGRLEHGAGRVRRRLRVGSLRRS